MHDFLARHQPHSWLPDWSDFWSELRTGVPGLRSSHLIRLEEELKDGHYVLHAELPGVDPAKDIDITVHNGQLTIKAERSEKKETGGRSEFCYGSLTRSITLPADADEDAITATYDKGILTVDVAVPEQKAAAPDEKHITVRTAG